MFHFSARSYIRMAGIDKQIILVMEKAIKCSPIDFGIPQYGGFRSTEDQQKLYNQRTVSGKRITRCDGIEKVSRHQSGDAVDFYAYVNGKASWEKHHLAMVAGGILSIAKQMLINNIIDVELEWGGTFGSNSFNGWDMPHIQIKRPRSYQR